MNLGFLKKQSISRPDRADSALSAQNITKSYGDVTAIDEVSFEIESGSVVGLLGPNGAGKTTTLKSMLGTVVPDSGRVEIFGVPVHRNTRWISKHVGVMFEGSRDAYWRLTVRENLEFFTRLNGVPASERRDRHDELLERLDLAEKADVPVRKLSRGQKQKVALASTLAREIDVAFLDEPTLGLDVNASLTLQKELRSLVDGRDLTVVLTSHDMDVVENICDRVIVISDGRVIADDSVENLLDIFDNDAYRVRLEAPISDDAVATLRSRFDVTNLTEYADVLELDVKSSGDGVYELSNELEALNCSVASLETRSPDLEEVFLDITDGETYDA